mgnify:CR=1 FL=1
MEEKKKEIRISVRNLVEFILRSGDLDNSSGGFGERDAMQAGTRVHQQITVRRFRWFTKKNMSISSCASREEQTACTRTEPRP